MSYKYNISQIVGNVNKYIPFYWEKRGRMIDPEFGKRFTEIIEKSGISNAKLTELAEISKNNISNYKNGQIPNATTLYKLSQILGKSMEYIIAGKEPEELTLDEQQLIDHYRRCDERGKRSIMRIAESESTELESSASKLG